MTYDVWYSALPMEANHMFIHLGFVFLKVIFYECTMGIIHHHQFHHHLSSKQNLGYLVYKGDYTTQLYRDFSKPLPVVPHKAVAEVSK